MKIFKLLTLITVIALLVFPGCKKKGCRDKTAENYDPKAGKDDGSCYYGERVVFWSYVGQSYHIDIYLEGEDFRRTISYWGPLYKATDCDENFAYWGGGGTRTAEWSKPVGQYDYVAVKSFDSLDTISKGTVNVVLGCNIVEIKY